MNAQLLELQHEDENDIENQLVEFKTLERRSPQHSWKKKKATTKKESEAQALQRATRSNNINYREEEDEVDENLIYRIGPRVKAFVLSCRADIEVVEDVSSVAPPLSLSRA